MRTRDDERYLRACQRPDAQYVEYLGDGVYAAMVQDGIWLTAENGAEVTDAIFLEPEVFQALKKFVGK